MKREISVTTYLVFLLLLLSFPTRAGASSPLFASPPIAVRSTVIMGELYVPPGTVVQEDAVVILGKGIIEGQVRGDVINILGEVIVNEQVEGDLVSILGETTLMEKAFIKGQMIRVLSDVDQQAGAQIAGGEVQVLPRSPVNFSAPRPGQALGGPFFLFMPGLREISFSHWGWRFSSALFSGILALLVLALFPKQVRRARENIQGAPAKAALWGFLGYLITFPAILFFGITIIGIPIALLLGLALWALRFLGYVALVVLVGTACLRLINSPASLGAHTLTATTIATVALGILAISLVTAIPLAGFFVSLAVSLISLGGSIMLGLGTAKS